MKLDAIAQTLFGAVFGLRVLDTTKPLWARVGFGLVAADLLGSGLKDLGKPDELVPTQVAGLRGVTTRSLGRAEPDDGGISKRPLKFRAYRVRTIQDRVALVHKQMVDGTKDPKVYQLAREVVTRRAGDDWAVAEKDHKGEATAIFNEVRKRVRYTWDPTDYDAFQTAVRTLELHAGDCDDMTSLTGALLRSIGHQVRTRIVQTKGSSTWNHIYLTVKVGNEWMPLDPSVAKPAGWEVPDAVVIRKQDFDVVES